MITAERVRNVAVLGHGGEGKTTLCEAILFNAKAIDRQGRVEDGNTTMDYDPEEISKKNSVGLGLAYCTYKDVKFNILDTPGFFDFEGEVFEALSAADCAVIVTGGNGALTVGTDKALDYCLKNKIPAILFINGLDKDNSNFIKTVNAVKEKYGNKIAPRIIPNIVNEKMKGYVKVAYGVLRDWDRNEFPVPDNLKEDYINARQALTEAAAENDEELLDKFFRGEELSGEEIDRGIKKGIKACNTITVLGGSALYNQGVFNLMDKIISTFPSAAESEPVKAADGYGKDVTINYSEKLPVVIHVFKTVIDPFVGRLNYIKVIRGTLKTGAVLKNARGDGEEKISALYFVKGKKQEAVNEITAGDIGAVSKLNDVATGDTLYEAEKFVLPPIEMPKAMYQMAVYAGKKGDEDKIFAGLKKLQDEDVSFGLIKNRETGEMIISGVGETQLGIIVKKLKNKFGSEAVLKEPKIAYRETIKKTAEAEGKHKKQSGGAGQYGDCFVRFEPGAEDGVYEFVDAVVGGAVPKQFIPAVDKGLREAVKCGVLAGYPMVNIKCTLFDGKYHPVDSKEIAFVTAAKLAYQEGVPKASPVILEPIMSLKITVPEEFTGDVMGDMNKRRGRILGTDMVDGNTVVSAEAPQAEVLKYSVDLRSMTQGRGKYEAEIVRYDEVPPQYEEKIIEAAKQKDIK